MKTATIRVPCPDCGAVLLHDVDQIGVRICIDTCTASYWFVCPECGRRGADVVAFWLAARLRDRGVTVETWSLPAELHEHPAANPISVDDVIDFSIALRACDHIAEEAQPC